MKSREGKEWPPAVMDRVRARFDVQEICIGPGEEQVYDEAQWRDALVVVESGTIELEWLMGARRRFTAGDLLSLSRLRLRFLRNPGLVSAVLSATTRHPARP